ncbi:mRNA-decapping enzyme subunit 2 [Basidiobolus ranarum]|uniref:mRNA-decapping enzyme subunit 2 n=1 Tax=Basidiobolus ranarum TaxID=34480 RepID=A0ABR2VSQ1_9FUNG
MYFETASLPEILDDLCSRFIINVPDEELASVERICFQIEQAHWFYEDFIRELNPSLPMYTLKNFSAKIFKHCPLLHQWANEHEKAYNDFLQYKFRVPVCGAIILNENQDKCLLVKGWTSRSGWGFPRGKINKDEPDSTCAIREVLEETGFDIGPYLKDDQFIEVVIHEQRIKLFIATGVPESTVFTPLTRKEISKIEWHRISDLPTSRVKTGAPGLYDISGSKSKNRYYMIIPFVSRLKSWINRRNKGKSGKRSSSVKSSGSSSRLSTVDGQTNAENQIKSLLGIVNGQGMVKEHQTKGHHDHVSNDVKKHIPVILSREQSLVNDISPEVMLKSMLKISDSKPSQPITQSPSPSYLSQPSEQMHSTGVPVNSNQPLISTLTRTPDNTYITAQQALNHERYHSYGDQYESHAAPSPDTVISNPPVPAANQLKSLLGITKSLNPSGIMPSSQPPNINSSDINVQSLPDIHLHTNGHQQSNPNTRSLLNLLGKSSNAADAIHVEPNPSNAQLQPSNTSAQSLLTLLSDVTNTQAVPNASVPNRRTSQTTANAANELLGFVSSRPVPYAIPESPKLGQSQMLKQMLGINSNQQIRTENSAPPSSDQIKALLNIDSKPMMAQ